ncbi:RNA polymerase sigma-54 factor 2 [uncultured Gammaproteobacteria bacterium]
MALTQRLDLRQAQTLVMTPQLQQAIKLLQLSNLELSDFVDREIEQNPLLERDDGEGGFSGDGGAAAGGGAEGGGESGDGGDSVPSGDFQGEIDGMPRDTVDLTTSDRMATGDDAPLDADFSNVWSHGSVEENSAGGGDEAFGQWSNRSGSMAFEDGDANLEQTLSGETSLRDHLIGQLNCDLADPGDRLIGLTLIDHLDEAGYLIADLGAIAEQFGCPTARVEQVLARLQRFDPCGIFARSLAECLANQLREKNRLDPAMQALLANLHLLAARNLPALIKVCGVDAEDITEMVAEIRALNPKPALVFDHVLLQPITPDILMRALPGGGWVIDLNPDTLPRVLVNQRYFVRISGDVRKKADRDYLAERLNSANWLVRSLHQRATTILKVASEIIRQQDSFFIHGVQFLRPLILRDIAEVIGMHESTVSRVTTNKFMATPRGIFELKYFFTSSIAGADGVAAHSAESVRFKIKGLIDAETADSVLSDDRLVEILRADSIDIARRTVAKYREAMNIPSSVQRRRLKSLLI